MEVKWVKNIERKPAEYKYGFSAPTIVYTNYGHFGVALFDYHSLTWEFETPTQTNESVLGWLENLTTEGVVD